MNENQNFKKKKIIIKIIIIMKSRIVKNNQFSKIELILDQRFAENQEEILKKIQIVKKV